MTGLTLKKETPKGRALTWYEEPFGMIYRDPHDSEQWLGWFWDGRQKQYVWQPMQDRFKAAVQVLGAWTQACKVDLLAARYTNDREG